MMTRSRKDPLAPIESLVHLFLTLIAAAIALWALFIVTDQSPAYEQFGMGGDSVCVENTRIYLPNYDDARDREMAKDLGIKPHASIHGGETTVCNNEPGAKEQALSGLGTAPPFFLFLGFLLLTRRVVKRARSMGLFTAATARGVQQLGYFLLGGVLLTTLVQWLAKGVLLGTMVEGMNWNDGPIPLSVPALFGAFGVVTIGRVMARAVVLQDEVDATI